MAAWPTGPGPLNAVPVERAYDSSEPGSNTERRLTGFLRFVSPATTRTSELSTRCDVPLAMCEALWVLPPFGDRWARETAAMTSKPWRCHAPNLFVAATPPPPRAPSWCCCPRAQAEGLSPTTTDLLLPCVAKLSFGPRGHAPTTEGTESLHRRLGPLRVSLGPPGQKARRDGQHHRSQCYRRHGRLRVRRPTWRR